MNLPKSLEHVLSVLDHQSGLCSCETSNGAMTCGFGGKESLDEARAFLAQLELLVRTEKGMFSDGPNYESQYENEHTRIRVMAACRPDAPAGKIIAVQFSAVDGRDGRTTEFACGRDTAKAFVHCILTELERSS